MTLRFSSVPFILWCICPPSTLLPPPSLYEPLPNTFHSKSVPQSRLVISSLTTLFLVGVLEGLKNLTWKKVIKNRLDVFATPVSFRDPKTWWILSLLHQGLYTVSMKLHIRAMKVINVSSTNIFGDTSTLILSRESQLAPSTRNAFTIIKKNVKCPKARVRWPMHHYLLTESLPQWSLINRYHQVAPNVELTNSWAGEVPVSISLIIGCLLARPSDALSNCWARPVA